MGEEAVLSEEVRRLIGTKAPPFVIEVEKGAVKKLAQAIEDPNPLWQDEEYAKKTIYGGIIAPPSFLCTAGTGFGGRIEVPLPLKRLLLAGDEVEFRHVIRPGDVLTCNQELIDIYEREGKAGEMVFLVYENTFTNQRGEVVAKGRATYARY
jgi:acyl dehydratase